MSQDHLIQKLKYSKEPFPNVAGSVEKMFVSIRKRKMKPNKLRRNISGWFHGSLPQRIGLGMLADESVVGQELDAVYALFEHLREILFGVRSIIEPSPRA